jgi:hypothetical protein
VDVTRYAMSCTRRKVGPVECRVALGLFKSVAVLLTSSSLFWTAVRTSSVRLTPAFERMTPVNGNLLFSFKKFAVA